MKKVIVTGASGPIGTVLCKMLSEMQVTVLAIVRKNSTRKANLVDLPGVNIVEMDISNLPGETMEGWNDCDTCFHLAWTHTGDEGRNDPVLQADNIKITLAVAEFAKRHGCKVFIGAGSQAEYGLMTGKVNEESPTNPTTLYGTTKLAAGKLVMEYCKQNQMRCNWIRIFSVYGPYENDYILTSYVIKKLLSGEIPELTKCEQTWDYLFVEDAVGDIINIAQKAKKSGVFCLGSGSARCLREYIEIIRNEINPKLELGIGKKDYSSNQLMHLEADISKLKSEIGIAHRYSFEDGIKKTILWYKDNISKM